MFHPDKIHFGECQRSDAVSFGVGTVRSNCYVAGCKEFPAKAQCIREVVLSVSPVMSATGWRVVLTWGSAPLYFVGSETNPYQYEVFYNNHRW